MPSRDATAALGHAFNRILRERARLLARPLDEAVDDHVALLTFTVAGSRYAVEISQVREVLASPQISRLPWGSAALAGVTNVRGAVVLVADAARLVGGGEGQPDGSVVVLDGGREQPLGLLVDAVDDVIAITAGSLVAPPRDAESAANELVLGVTTAAVVLDVAALLQDPRIMIQQGEGA